jgi:DNA-binding beta-propeller fold protein YncE
MKPSSPSVEEDCAAPFKSAFRSQDDSAEKLSPPSGFCFTPKGNLILADDFNHRIQIYGPDHKLITSFGRKGKNPGELHYPRGIAVDREENIYVADSWNHRLQKFDAGGNHLLTIGSCGESKGLLNEPYDVFIDAEENILVVERYNHRIQIFGPKGDSKGWVGSRGTVVEEELASIYETPKHLFNAPAFEFPTSIAQDSLGNYFITDSGNHRIVKFDSRWNLLLTFGERGKGSGQFEYPLCVAIDPNDLLYVADLNNDRVQIFTSTGRYVDEMRETQDSASINAPCLTAIDPSGTLHVGLTFDTRVMTFQTPTACPDSPQTAYSLYHEAQQSQQRGNREKALQTCQTAVRQILAERPPPDSGNKYVVDLLVNFSSLAQSTEDKNNEPLLLESVTVLSRHLDADRQRVLATYLEWEEAAVHHNRQLFEKQKQVLEEREDSRVFNRDLFQAETRDKILFRKLRHQFYELRKTIEQGSEFFGNVINSNLSESGLRACLDALEARTDQICEQVLGLMEAKETNEKSMVASFAEMQGQQGAWETFLIRSNTNARIMDVLRQFHFEIRSLLANIKGAVLKYPRHDAIARTLKRQFIDPEGSEKFMKILLGFQEEWLFHKSLEIGFKDLTDLWQAHSGIHKNNPPVALNSNDLQPVPFDTEQLVASEMARPLLIEGMPLIKTDAGVACGHLHFSRPSENKENWLPLLESLLENERVYETRYQETLQQLEGLSGQKQELEAKLNRVNPQDKKTPITLQNNLSVLTFQVSLLKRMVLTMEINEADNLFRLALGAALFIASEQNTRTPEISAFLKSVRSFQSSLDEKISAGMQERKTLAFEASRLNGLLQQIETSNAIGDLNRTLEIKDQTAKIEPRKEELDAVLNRHFKVRNWIGRLLEFDATCRVNDASRKDSPASLPCKFSFANSGPITRHLLQPYGITQTRQGDFVLTDYENHQVVRFSSQGVYKNRFGGWGNSPGFFKYPVNVQADSLGCLYVADEQNIRIQKFDPETKFLFSFGDREQEDQRLGPVFSLSIDAEDRVWVADPSHNRVQIYSPDGKLIRSLNKGGNSPEDLHEPVSIHCLANGEYLVGDKSIYLLKHFDAHGVMQNGLKKEGLAFGEIYFLDSHPDHGIYATDYWNNQILHLNFQLEVISIAKNPGKRAGQWGKVGGLVVAKGQLAVADFENFRVQVLTIPGL